MTDLILHVGLSKCGSTTIQKSLADTEGYLGRASKDYQANQLGQEFMRLSPRNPVRSATESDLLAWKENVKVYASKKSWNGNIIFSNEVLSSPRYGHLPLLNFLSRLKAKVWQDGTVKVILVVRNQCAKIPSEYAQNSDAILNASQADFEMYVEKRCSAADLYYCDFVQSLHQVLGPENVKVLFLEEIGESAFWKDLYSFCGLDSNVMCKQNKDLISNKKSIQGNTWVLSDPGSEVAAKGFSNKVLLWTWPSKAFPTVRKVFAAGLRNLYFIVNFGRRLIEHRREKQITLSTSLEERIKDQFKESNTQLGALVDRDLSELEY